MKYPCWDLCSNTKARMGKLLSLKDCEGCTHAEYWDEIKQTTFLDRNPEAIVIVIGLIIIGGGFVVGAIGGILIYIGYWG